MSDKPLEDIDDDFFKKVAFPAFVVGLAFVIIELFKYIAK